MQQPAVPEPEILHSDLSSLVSELTQWGAVSADELQWLDIPPQASVEQAKQLLQSLDILDSNGQFTALGKLAQRLGLEPRIASMLIKAQQNGQALLNAAIVAAALLEEPERNVTDIQHSLHRLKQRKHSKNNVVMQKNDTLSKPKLLGERSVCAVRAISSTPFSIDKLAILSLIKPLSVLAY